MELRQYLGLLRKWGWLIVLTTAIAAGSSFYYSRTIPPIYQATTTLIVGQALENPNPSGGELQVASQLASAYALLVKQQPILQATQEALHLPGTWQGLLPRVSTSAVGGQLLQISVNATEPRQAKAIADEVAHQLILQSPTSIQQQQVEEQRVFVTSQLADLKVQIETGQRTLAELSNRASIESDPDKLKDLDARILALQTKIDNWQKNYASLSALLNTRSSNFLNVIAPAQEPIAPISPNIPQNVLFAALAGLVLAGAAIFLLEYLDDTVKIAEDVQRDLGLPTLGAISRIANLHEPTENLVTAKHPRSPIAEAYRVLRTNLRFSGIQNPSGALLVTSAGPGEGKSTTVANLGVAMAQSGKRVVVVDTDLRRPSLHKYFGLTNTLGLSSLFLGEGYTLENVMQPTATEGLRVITSGPLPPNPAEILDSKQMGDIMAELRAQSDMVLFDSPPVLAVADASILGSRCSGAMIVIESGHTRTEVSRRAVENLKQTGVKVVGAVLNKYNARRASGYYYYYYYYSQTKPASRNGKGQA